MGTTLLPNLWEKKQEVCTRARTEITREPLSWDKCILPQVMDGLRVWGRVDCWKQSAVQPSGTSGTSWLGGDNSQWGAAEDPGHLKVQMRSAPESLCWGASYRCNIIWQPGLSVPCFLPHQGFVTSERELHFLSSRAGGLAEQVESYTSHCQKDK